MWTASALASEARPDSGKAWRVVEHQHTVATRKLVDTLEEQALLEDILEESKPAYPAEAQHLDYLLKTPFRYPPSPWGSRFRRPFEGHGVFYCAEARRSALAEFSYWRRRFFAAAKGTPLPRGQEALTLFQVAWRSAAVIDLCRPPLKRDERKWTHPDDYSATQALAGAARAGGIEVIRYRSVRDPQGGANLALLTPGVFQGRAPRQRQTWYLYLAPGESNCLRASRDEVFTFPSSG